MPHLHRDKGLAYLCTPRTGSRATSRALEDIGFERVGVYHGHMPSYYRPLESIVTTIRDPKDILASWVRRNLKPDMSPEEIVRHEVETNTWVANGHCASLFFNEITSALRYEKGLQVEVNRWLDTHNLPSVQLDTPGQSQGSVTDAQWALIKEYTHGERKKLGYI